MWAETIRQRGVALSVESQRLLGVAAVLGGTVSSTLLAEIAAQAEDTALDALRAACRARLLVDEGEDAYRFAHDLVREVVEADVGMGHRKLLHRRAVEAIERSPGEPPVERLAYHYARDGVREKAVVYLQRAGDRAQALLAHAEAEGHYREVVDQLDGLGRAQEAAGVREKLVATLMAQTRYDEALRELELAAGTHRAVGNREGFWRATAQMGWVHASRGTPEAGIACLQQLHMSQFAQEPAHGLAVLQVALAHLYLHAGQYEQAGERYAAALAICRQLGEGLYRPHIERALAEQGEDQM